MTAADGRLLHEAFWRGEGPCLILIPNSRQQQYDTVNYPQRFADPVLMWEAEMRRARAVAAWPTDGIPTVRPNLGVIFIPGALGQSYTIQEDQMPWPGRPMSRDEIRCLPSRDIEHSEMMARALQFYEVHTASGETSVLVYHPDTQGVFSLAHLLYGDRIFTDLADDPGWVHTLLEITVGIHKRAIRALKSFINEPNGQMAHGHSYPAGIWFPHAGVRISEDTATMISPRMIPDFVLPYTTRAVEPWGGCFVHYCGKHKTLFEGLCDAPCVRAIDLGNPEMYDTRWLLERCAETDTVMFSPLAAESGETWEPYLQRIARLTRETGARVILRPVLFPDTHEGALRMRQMWHDLTC
jgi:hypothetical protein